MAETFRDLWSEVARITQRSQNEYRATEAEFADRALKGWRFGGCPDGVRWIARHRDHGEVIDRTGAGLVAKVKAIEESKAEAKRIREMPAK